MRILSLCTSAGLWDKAWIEAGHHVIAGCEIMDHKRRIYRAWHMQDHLCLDLRDLPALVCGRKFDGVIGGIPCQSFSRTKSNATPKFGDLASLAEDVLSSCKWDWFLFENVSRLRMKRFDCAYSRMDAMHYGKPHQSRIRYFTHSRNLSTPSTLFRGNGDSLLAYPAVAGRIYGPKRGAIIQGFPDFSDLPFPAGQLQECLADGVPRCLSEAWIHSITRGFKLNAA